MSRSLIALISALSLALPLTARAGDPASAPGPATPGSAVVPAPASPAAAEPDARVYVGVWALTDSLNNLFNVRLLADGRAVSTVGTAGVPLAGARRLRGAQLHQQGRWRVWGNGVRVDYADGWSDWIYVGPAGFAHAAWPPGQNRGGVPANFGPAVRLVGPLAQVVGVYRFPPAQRQLPPYTATLLSNGLAFNAIDERSGGVWSLEGSTVLIDWVSGWRTTLSLDPATPLQLRHWPPGADRRGPSSGGVRQGHRLE